MEVINHYFYNGLYYHHQHGGYLEIVILVLVSSRIFLIIFPSLPMIRPQYLSSISIFKGTVLQKPQIKRSYLSSMKQAS